MPNKKERTFINLFKTSTSFKRLIIVSTFFFSLLTFFIFAGIIKSNEKIFTLMKDRQANEFDKIYFSTVEHYKKLSITLYKEFVSHDFLEQLYQANFDKNKLDTILKEVDKELVQKYAFNEFNISLSLKNDDKTYEFKPTTTIHGLSFKKSLIYKNRYLGVLNINLTFMNIHKWIEKLNDGHVYMMVKKSSIVEEQRKNFEDSYINNDYVHIKKNMNDMMKHCFENVKHITKNEYDKINLLLNKEFKNINLSDKPYVDWFKIDQEKDLAVIFKPIFNDENNPIGYLVNYIQDKEFTKYEKIYNISVKILIIIMSMFYFLILYILHQREKDKLHNIELKSAVKDLRNAKSEVSAKQLELLLANSDLETKVESSVKKEREKDKIMFQQSKLATMGEMIGNIAHQWRQPLNALSLQIQDVKEAYNYNEIDKEYVTNLVDNSMKNIDFMSKTIDDFRNFFEPNKTKVNFDIVESIEHVLEIIKLPLKKNRITIKIDKENETHISNGYPNEFKQVVLNLINNAKDELIEKEINVPEITIEIKEENGFNVINIKDNARGVPEYLLDRIFEPYFTTKAEQKGSGLGLYMSKMIIEENMDGSLYVKNSLKGAIFTIKLKANKI